MKSEVDISMIKKNLELSPENRLKNHQGALDLLTTLKNAGKFVSDKPQRASKKTT